MWGRIVAVTAVVAFVAWWLGGLIGAGVVIAAFVGFVLLVVWSRRHEAKLRAMLEENGQR